MESKVIIKVKSKLENSETFKQNLEKEINKYLEQNYKVVSSNMTQNDFYMYIYVLMVKE